MIDPVAQLLRLYRRLLASAGVPGMAERNVIRGHWLVLRLDGMSDAQQRRYYDGAIGARIEDHARRMAQAAAALRDVAFTSAQHHLCAVDLHRVLQRIRWAPTDWQ